MATNKPRSPSDEEVRTLLIRYRCPIPFHAVRTRFLGSIASPAMGVSPIEAAKSLWGGELPQFNSIDALNEFLAALVMGLWNRLAQHQERKVPFRLVRVETPRDRHALGRLAMIRREELEGFIDGLFGPNPKMDFPERASQALDELGQVRGYFQAIQELTDDSTKPTTPKDINDTLHNVHALTKIAELEIHKAVLSCTKARRDVLQGLAASKPRPH